jgi:hypothetical protein
MSPMGSFWGTMFCVLNWDWCKLGFRIALLCKCPSDRSSPCSTGLLKVWLSCECVLTYYFYCVSFSPERSRISAFCVIHFKVALLTLTVFWRGNRPLHQANHIFGWVSSTVGTWITECEVMNPGQSKPLVHSRSPTQIVHGFMGPSNTSNICTLHPIARNRLVLHHQPPLKTKLPMPIVTRSSQHLLSPLLSTNLLLTPLSELD